MLTIDTVPEIQAAVTLIDSWIGRRVQAEAYSWFRQQGQLIANAPSEQSLVRALGLAARKLGKADLYLTGDELAQASRLRSGFDPSCWSIDQAARVAFILASYRDDEQEFAALLDSLSDHAEMNELIALYCGFALYPAASRIEHRAREAIRSSMRPVFEAMAHRNPYPLEYFDEPAWNQMIVKTFFLDSPLWPVQGVEQRNNPALAGILLDLVHERWAAGRIVSPELWRCVTPHAIGQAVQTLLRALQEGSDHEKLAIAKSLPSVNRADILPVRRYCEENGLIATAHKLDWQQIHEGNLITT